MSLIHQIALTFIKSVGHVLAKSLLAQFGTAEAVFTATRAQLLQVEGIGSIIASQILQTNAMVLAEEQLKFIDQYQIRTLFYTDAHYPQRLKNCYDAPVLLYYKGTADLNHPRIISIVGTRKATPYGLLLCKQLAEALQHYGVLVVSGLAYGIDVAAHKQSLLHHLPTVGVLAHGLDRLYPAAHRETAAAMLKNGGLLTEFPFHTVPRKENFPKRNRIIAGLSDATIVVEATLKGGALITADIAGSYDRDVFAFSGKTTDEYSQGCNFLIKTNRAGLLSQAKDLVYYLGWEVVIPVEKDIGFTLPEGLSKEELKIIQLLRSFPLRVDELGRKSEIQQHKLALCLLNLEMNGVIISLPGSIYQLI